METTSKLNLDKLDHQIIHHMMNDANVSYAELGKKFFVSAGNYSCTHKKITGCRSSKGTRFNVDFKKLGYDVIAFIGIYLKESSMYDAVAKELGKMPQIVRLNYTTGNYSMFAEVVCRDINELKQFYMMSFKK
jgi:Lrp/AsnC family transcriptional regulator for asnA, asnC and gidA